MRKQHGFTVIEIMIAMAVVGILAAIALPNYTQYMQRSKITEATSQLSATRVRLEQWFQDNRTYCAAAGCPTCPATVISTAPAQPIKYFSFAGNCATAGTYTITATGVAGEGMGGFTYTINEVNGRTTTLDAATGWLNQNCGWVLRKDGSC
jgi:type IV pilus assembly protein PilE